MLIWTLASFNLIYYNKSISQAMNMFINLYQVIDLSFDVSCVNFLGFLKWQGLIQSKSYKEYNMKH